MNGEHYRDDTADNAIANIEADEKANRMHDEFYKSARWIRCRQSYIDSTDGLCEMCKKNGIIKPGIIVHHKKYITDRNINDESITLNHDNLMLLCWECHSLIHHGTEMKESRVVFNEDGSISPRKL